MNSKDVKPSLSLAGVEGMQSVRTTFRLSKKADEALDSLGTATKTTIKELLGNFAKGILTEKVWEDIIVDSAKNVDLGQNSVRKTFVISKTALTLINTTAKKRGVPRDALVESLIVLADQLVSSARKLQPEKHKTAQSVIGDFWDKANEVEAELKELLGEDDPVYVRFSFVGTILMNLSMAIDAEIEKGIPVNPDDIGQQG